MPPSPADIHLEACRPLIYLPSTFRSCAQCGHVLHLPSIYSFFFCTAPDAPCAINCHTSPVGHGLYLKGLSNNMVLSDHICRSFSPPSCIYGMMSNQRVLNFAGHMSRPHMFHVRTAERTRFFQAANTFGSFHIARYCASKIECLQMRTEH